MDKICSGRREQWDSILTMQLIEFLNTVSFYTTQWNNFNKEMKRVTTFEGAVMLYLTKI